MLKAVFFDLDGTLMDSEMHYISGTVKWLNDLNIRVSEKDVFNIVGLSMDDTYKYLSELSGLSYDECVFYNEKYFKSHPLNFKKLIYKEVPDVFRVLKNRGLKTAICSMSPLYYIKQFVSDNNLDEYVDYCVSGEDLKHNKPAPDIYLKALDELKLKQDEVIVVEDAKSGIDSALAAGLRVVARDASRYHVDQHKASAILSDLNELIEMIG
ncbi:MAG: HAD family hydrolase [Erysipelotrichaceae bacterium]